MPPKTTPDDFVSVLFRAAEQHGQDSEPDHEVGDLQDIIVCLYERLSLEQRKEVAEDPRICAIIDYALEGGLTPE